MMDASALILCAYSFFNAARIFSYAPQIVLIARDRDGARAISLSTWALWIAANATTALHAWFNLGDVPLTLLNALNTLGCLTVVALTVWKRTTLTSPSQVAEIAG